MTGVFMIIVAFQLKYPDGPMIEGRVWVVDAKTRRMIIRTYDNPRTTVRVKGDGKIYLLRTDIGFKETSFEDVALLSRNNQNTKKVLWAGYMPKRNVTCLYIMNRVTAEYRMDNARKGIRLQ